MGDVGGYGAGLCLPMAVSEFRVEECGRGCVGGQEKAHRVVHTVRALGECVCCLASAVCSGRGGRGGRGEQGDGSHAGAREDGRARATCGWRGIARWLPGGEVQGRRARVKVEVEDATGLRRVWDAVSRGSGA